MELKLHQRQKKKKSAISEARRSGLIPAVVYKQGQPGQAVTVEEAAFSTFMRRLKPGHLPTTRLKLVDDKGKAFEAIVKEIQYHPTTYRVLHLDFLELAPDAEISVKIPIECTGVADCLGIKQGGVLRQVLRYVRVRCLPKNLPHSFMVDVKDLSMGHSRRLKDIAMDAGVRPLDGLNEVAVVIAKR
jgi:large subunit ribosomal protein L25